MVKEPVRIFCMEMVMSRSFQKLPEYLEWLESGLKMARKDYPTDEKVHKLLVFPEFVSLPLIYDDQSFLEHGHRLVDIFSDMAVTECAFVLTCAPQEINGSIFNTASLYSPEGISILSTSKKITTQYEKDLGFVASSELPTIASLPFGNVGIAICLDAFNSDYITVLKNSGVEILLQPSANAQEWAIPAVISGVWQPEEWTIATVGSVSPENYPLQYLVNPMLRGRDAHGRIFDGQSSIVRSSEILRDCPYVGVEKKYFAEFLFCSDYDFKNTHQVGWYDINTEKYL